MLRSTTTEAADHVELDALLGEGLDPCDVGDDGDEFGDLDTGELAAELVGCLIGDRSGEPTGAIVSAPAQALAAEASALFDAHWRSRALAVTRTPAAPPASNAPAAQPRRARPALVERLAVLRQRYPTLAAAHRNLTDVSDELLAALVEDIEHVTGDRDDGSAAP
jgi:hypothetical protein